MRPGRFCLCLQGGSVFADFDTDEDGRVLLRQISFDGYGCCGVPGSVKRMNADDSRLLVTAVEREAVEREAVDDPRIEAALRTYFRENSEVIWSDALMENGLL